MQRYKREYGTAEKMERSINKRIESHQVAFKNDIKGWLEKNKATVASRGTDLTSEFLKFVYDYGGIAFTREDLVKRKRVKNAVPHYELCIAKRANGEQCTRRRKNSTATYCGTHEKGQPHGVIEVNPDEKPKAATKVEVWVEQIQGINYYIDAEQNVYLHEDILANKPNPSVIAKWDKKANGAYYIPAFRT